MSNPVPHATQPPADDDALERVRASLDAEGSPTDLASLAALAGLSPTHLQRAFRRRFGVSPAEYARSRRFDQLRSELRDGADVTTAVYNAGFGSGSRVYEESDRRLGMTPASYRAGGAGASIRYTTTDTPLGRLLVATTAKGICSVTLGSDDSALETRLKDEFPLATHERVDEGREAWLDAVIARVAHELGWQDREAPAMPPFDVAATAFQQRVWDALTRIPRGETLSYGELAATLGVPKAARAIGRACGSNKLALLVPCHRIIREDGNLGGWRWGLEIKQQLLATERAMKAAQA
jgi:AraC family transcriptional regulator of adaptative response/methylated-DNA-[protein]-cysteine methyltransferase